MGRSVATVFGRWLNGSCAEPPAAAGGCGRRLGTGHDEDVARVLRGLQDDAPRDHDAYLRNVRDLQRVAEADLAIAAARALHHRGKLVHGRAGTAVRLYTANGESAGTLTIRSKLAEGEPHTWRFSARVPEALAAEMARLAPSWVAVEKDSSSGPVVLRGPKRRRPPPQWTRRLPQLRTPPAEETR
jgi:hypothetical protein